MSNSWQNPYEGQEDVGKFHPRPAGQTAWDVNGIDYSYSSPYVWDISRLTPVGVNAVTVFLVGYIGSDLAIGHDGIQCWDYDLSMSSHDYFSQGLYLCTSYKPATSGVNTFVHASIEGIIVLRGTSRKLKIGSDYRHVYIYAMLKGYYI